jgi:hypothetical protein
MWCFEFILIYCRITILSITSGNISLLQDHHTQHYVRQYFSQYSRYRKGFHVNFVYFNGNILLVDKRAPCCYFAS